MKLIEPPTIDYLKKQKEIAKSLHDTIQRIGDTPDGYFKIEMSTGTGRVHLRFDVDKLGFTLGCETIYACYRVTDWRNTLGSVVEIDRMCSAFDTMAEKINPEWSEN